MKHEIPDIFIRAWAEKARKLKMGGMITVLNKEKGIYFPHYIGPQQSMWDMAVMYDNMEDYEVVDLYVFIEEL
jgi:hypothetical protein